MKIAFFTDVFGPHAGGIASSVAAQKQTLEELGHEVVVFFPYRKKLSGRNLEIVPTCPHFHPAGIPVARRPKIIERWVLERYSDFDQFDIVHTHYEAGASIAGARLARKFKIPLVQTMHGREDSAVMENIWCPFRTIVGFILTWVHSWCLPHNIKIHKDNYLATTYARAYMWSLMINQANYADLVITPSKHFRDKFQHYGVTRPIAVLTNTIDDGIIPENIPVRQLKKGEPLRMVWNSRVSHEKRIWEFLHALQYVNFPFQLDVYGGGNELRKARLWAKQRKLPIKFHGARPRKQIIETMADSHLSILASYNFDNQPMTLLEAVAAGLPMFFCDPDMEEVVPEGSFVCAGGPSVQQMVTTLNHLYAHPEQIQQMSRVATKYSQTVLRSAHTNDLIDLYTKLQKS